MSSLLNQSINQLSVKLGDILLSQHKQVTTAESCTGGGIAYAITEVPGSSAWFQGAWVTYSNEIKTSELTVSKSTLDTCGAVSQEVVHQMALGALDKSGADISVAVSGIAGPDGGSEQKPVGLVCFSIAQRDSSSQVKSHTFSRCFSGDRKQVREQTIKLALKELVTCLVT